MSGLQQTLQRLEKLHAETRAQQIELVTAAEAEGRSHLSEAATVEFRRCTDLVADLDERIADLREEIARSGRGDSASMEVRKATAMTGGAGGPDARSAAQAWARTAAHEIRAQLGGKEGRAIVSGSVDVPSLVLPEVIPIPYPQRVIDLLVNREPSTYAYEFYQQTAKVNNAAPVADLGAKPVSTFTVKAVQDRCRVIAHLSEPLPFRMFTSIEPITSWLSNQMAEGVFQGIEHEAISGDGTGESQVGVLHTTGTTAVPYTTDLPTTLRSAITSLQNLGETPTGWVFNPADAETLDLLRWGTAGGLLTGGVENDTGNGFGTSDNILGTVRRVISPSVPAGTAVLADWRQLKLFLNTSMMVLANAFGDSLFTTNSVQLRGEQLVGIGVLRPQAFAVVDLTSGS